MIIDFQRSIHNFSEINCPRKNGKFTENSLKFLKICAILHFKKALYYIIRIINKIYLQLLMKKFLD